MKLPAVGGALEIIISLESHLELVAAFFLVFFPGTMFQGT
jgi:hypothetical protein